MLQFLEIYLSVLKAVEKECPGSVIPLESKYYSNLLVRELRKQVCKTSGTSFGPFKRSICTIINEAPHPDGACRIRHASEKNDNARWHFFDSSDLIYSVTCTVSQVGDAAPAASQGQQLLQEIEASDSFHRKMMAHSILYKAHHFLVDSKLVINKRERSRGGGRRGAITFYAQKLK